MVGLCNPGASFDFMVDSKACEAKLESFCHSLRDATPNDPHLKLADRLYDTCMDSAKNEKGLAAPRTNNLEPSKTSEAKLQLSLLYIYRYIHTVIAIRSIHLANLFHMS